MSDHMDWLRREQDYNCGRWNNHYARDLKEQRGDPFETKDLFPMVKIEKINLRGFLE